MVRLFSGVMVPPTTMRTKEDFELQMGTNHLGHYLLARMLIPLLKKAAKEADNSRVLVVSSLAHLHSGGPIRLHDLTYKNEKNTMNAYSQSKVLFTM